MDKQPCNRTISAITRHPWAILPEYLTTILAIAAREYSNPEAVLAVRAERHESGEFKIRDGAAIIPIMGPIMPYGDSFSAISGATSIEGLSLRFNTAIKSSDVREIIFHVDSPGGQIVGVHELVGMIRGARGTKPIVSYVTGTCASAAYWIASAAEKIISARTGIIGSIGIVAAWTDDSQAREDAGLKDYEIVSSQTPNKNLDPTKKEGRAALQKQLDALADIFIEDAATNRGKSAKTVQEKFGQGGTMLAEDAVKAGMIDSVGSLEGIIAARSQGNAKLIIGGSTMTEEEKRRIAAEATKGQSEEDDEESNASEDKEDDDKAKKAKKAKKAEDDEEKKAKSAEDDEDDEDDKDAKKAALRERNRIKAIMELGIIGHDDLVRKAMFDQPMSAQELALTVLMAEKKARASIGADYGADARAVAGVPSAPIGVGAESRDRTDEIANMIAAGYQKRPALSIVK